MRKSIKILILAILVTGIAGCSLKSQDENPPENIEQTAGYKSPSTDPSVDMPSGEPSVIAPSDAPQTKSSGSMKCGLQSCHGLDLSCGANIPEACTEEYRLGDFCRQYAICEIIKGECSMISNPKLNKCIDCVKACDGGSGIEAFDCEEKCRDTI